MLDALRAFLVRLHNEPVLVRNFFSGLALILTVPGITIGDATIDTLVDGAGLLIAVLLTLSARARVTPV